MFGFLDCKSRVISGTFDRWAYWIKIRNISATSPTGLASCNPRQGRMIREVLVRGTYI